MEIRGLGQGLGVFHIDVVVQYVTCDGWSGGRDYPTFWVVGGNERDAVNNASVIIGDLEMGGEPPFGDVSGGEITEIYIRAVNANPDTPHRTVIWQASTGLFREVNH